MNHNKILTATASTSWQLEADLTDVGGGEGLAWNRAGQRKLVPIQINEEGSALHLYIFEKTYKNI